MSLPDRYAVAGHPVEHSQSPFIHAEFARQTGQSLHYGRLLCPLDGFAATVRAFAADDREGVARGCNVTMPFKFEAFAIAARRTARAERAGAANVLRFDADGWLADNADGIGLVRDIETHAATPIAGRRVLLLGAGGAACGVLGPLLEAGPSRLVIANRTLEKAQALAERHRVVAGAASLAAAAPAALDETFDIVVNGTATSLMGDAIPIGPQVLAPGALVVDMAYGAAARPFVDWADAHGARGRDGLGMLVEQAAESFALWRGVRPDAAPVLAALRERLAAKA